MREKIRLNDGWLFHKGDIARAVPTAKGPLYTQSKTENAKWGPGSMYYNDNPDDFRWNVEFNPERWERVTLPHDYIIKQTPVESENNALGYFHYENAWYRKHITLSAADRDKRLILYFEGVATHATVYFNGCRIKHNFCGYTPFEIDITDYARFDEDNVIAVYVNTQEHEGWWYEGGGIYRNVWLIKTDLTAIDTYGVYVHPEKAGEDTWNVQVETTVFNRLDTAVTVTVQSVIDGFSGCAKADVHISARSRETIKYALEVTAPLLWDIDSPHLYTVKTDVLKNGSICDSCAVRTGFRTYYADPDKGFFLNGRHVKIKGVCAHQDCGLTGKAVADNVNQYKISLIKQMGANGYRCSHYPQNEAIMDALDEQGLIVMAETRWYGSSEENISQLETLVKRDRNHPSIFFWSIGNEEPYHITEQGKKIALTMMAAVKRLDSTRLVMCAVDKPNHATVYDDLDIIGVNYNIDSYDTLHQKYPHKAILASECAAAATTRGWYWDDAPEKGYVRASDHDINSWFIGKEDTWNVVAERDFIQGAYQWIAFEYHGETLWPRLASQSGAIDLFLQKKDAFYQNQSHWLDQPMIHMLPHWNRGTRRDGEPINVWVYTNCQEAEILVNGKSCGRKAIKKYRHAEWDIPYQEGKIEAIGYMDGNPIAFDYNETTGAPERLMLKLENTVTANGTDVAIITCYTVDQKGRMVPDAMPYVDFITNHYGTIIATGSDVADHTPVTAQSRKMRAGLITVAVQIGTEAGTLSVCANAEHLLPARLDIELQ